MPFVKGKSGNPNGRPKKPINSDLMAAIKEVEGQEGKKAFMLHIVEQAYEDRTVAIALLNKLVPNLKQVDKTVDGQMSGHLTISWEK